jgi:Zn-dependent peptidase ImmA (M78 family)
MIFQNYPERNIASRLVAIKDLSPPVDIFSLAKQYAKVDLMSIPFDVDGITLHLKVPGKISHIIINDGYPHRRIRFTLAHELGHVLIPWHTWINY